MMTTRDFLSQVWPATGNYCIAAPHVNQDGKKGYKHFVFDDMTDAYHDTRVRYRNMDVYFGIFTHINLRVFSQTWQRDVPSRKRENMDQAKCLFLDLDVGKGKGTYATQEDALAALARFIYRTGFPAPIVVSSGNGLHVYWPLKDPVAADQWRPHAANLRVILDENHVMYDPSRTTDITSVLRVPNTINHKDPDNLKKVSILHEGDGESDNDTLFALLTLLGGHMQPIAAASYATPAGMPANIGPGTNFPPTDPDEVAAECEQIRIFRDQKGVVPEHHWYAALGLIGYCSDGENVAHQWSSGHPNYTRAETQAKLDQWKANGSVTSCAKLARDGAQGVCQRCPHFGGQFKNPVVIVNKKPAPVAFVASTPSNPNVALPPACPPPKPYQRTTGLSVTRMDAQGMVHTVTHELDLYPISVSNGLVGGHVVNTGVSTWVAREYHGKIIREQVFEISQADLVEAKDLKRRFFSVGIFNDVTADVVKYMSAYLRELNKSVGNRQQQVHLGWPGENDTSNFILNGRTIDRTGKIEPCVMARTVEIVTDGMTQAGTIQGQVDALKFYNRPGYEAHKFFILATIASPLFMATGHHGVVLNATGDSSAGKTTALKAAAAFWADPAKFIVNGTTNGISDNAREARMAAIPNLPTMVDEITHMEPDRARAMVMSATQARLRDTLKSDRTPREARLPGFRAALMMTTANSSLHQIINTGNNQAGTANSARVLEVLFDMMAQSHTKSEADAGGLAFDQNYGWLGPYFMARAMPCIDLLFESVRKMMKRIDLDVAASGIMRFVVASAASIFVAGTFAVYLGIVDWDMDAIYNWFVTTQMQAVREQFREQGAVVASDNIMREFIAAHALDTVIVTTMGVNNVPTTKPYSLRSQVAINHRETQKELWISKQVFTDWCRRKGTTVSNILADLVKLGVVTGLDVRKNLADGTNLTPTGTRCFIVKADHPLVM